MSCTFSKCTLSIQYITIYILKNYPSFIESVGVGYNASTKIPHMTLFDNFLAFCSVYRGLVPEPIELDWCERIF